jgi:hypothetical protein
MVANDSRLAGDRMNDEECKEMNAKLSGEWYPHLIIFQIQKVPFDQTPTNIYYRVGSELWGDLMIWLQAQEDAYKL